MWDPDPLVRAGGGRNPADRVRLSELSAGRRRARGGRMTPAGAHRFAFTDRPVPLRMRELHRATRARRASLVDPRVTARTDDLVHVNLCELVHTGPGPVR